MADKGGPLWQVTGQREDWGDQGNGTYGPGVTVSFRTASGATGSIFVPRAHYTAERVQEMIAAQAAEMERVAGLSG